MRRSLTLAAALLVALTLVQTAHAQTTCNRSKCTVRMASVSQVVDGCGEHATPGRMKIIFSSTDANVTRANFPVSGFFISATSDLRQTAFSDWEWRSSSLNGGRWSDPALNRIGYAGGVLGANIIEVRPKAGAHVWSNRNPNNVNQGPGELVVQDFRLSRGGGSNWASAGSAYFLFMGGKGCARVNEGGEDIGGVQ